MFLRLVYESFRRQKRRKLLAGVAITLGVTVATAMIAVAMDVGDKINHELRSLGANLIVSPQEDALDLNVGGVDLRPPSDGAFLNEADLPRIRNMYWRNNILGFSPLLTVNVGGPGANLGLLGTYFAKQVGNSKDPFITGVRSTNPWWKIQGTWPDDNSSDVLVGKSLAAKTGMKPGSFMEIAGQEHLVVGILSTGGAEDNQIVAPLHVAQKLLDRPGAVRRIYVSALTKPEDALARRDPKSMGPVLYDRWYCSPYPQSIAYQLQEAIPHSHAEEIRQVAQNEGMVLSRITGLMFLITLAALLTSVLAVSAAMATAIFERRAEVGLMKALGAGNVTISAIFFAEAALLALLGGAAGFAGGSVLARQIGRSIFGSPITIQPALFPVILALAVLVTFAGGAAAIRRAAKLDPVFALRGDL